MNAKFTYLLLICMLVSFPARGEVYDGLNIRTYEWHMNALNFPRTPGGDSVFAKPYNQFWYFNVDTLCYRMATEGHSVLTDDLLHHYYYQIADYASEEQIERGYRKMIAAAKTYNCVWLRDEAEYMKVNASYFSKLFSGPGVSEEELETSLKEMQGLTAQAIEKGYKSSQVELLFEAFQIYKEFGSYAKAFKYAPAILAELEKASEKERYNRHGIYFYVGDAYYRFHDYERAIPCLKAALHDNPTLYFPDRSDLQARNLLGEYYAQINELDSSDYYYRSMYDNRESVRFRPTYDVRAAAGIAYNLMKRGNYRQALSLLERWLPEAIDQKIYMEAYNITLALAECYLAENRSAQAKTMTDSAFTLIRHDRHNRFRRERLYEAIYHYGTATGNLSLARQYADSMQTAAAEYEKKTSSLIILRAEQEVFESEKALKDNQIKVHRMRFMLTFGGCILLLIFLGIGIYYNRVITRKNRGLYRQIKEQDSLNEEMERMTKRYENLLTSVSPSLEADAEKECPGDKQQKELVKRLSKYLLDGKNFNKPDIDLDGLVSELATNRSYLFEAVKTVTGKTLMECIQTLRLNEARQLIDNHPNLTIEAIAADCGFNNRQTFHRLFKEQYNISPAEYRKMVKNR